MSMTIGGIECLVIAIGTATSPNFPVTIGTGETGIYGHLLDPLAEGAAEVTRIGVEWSLVAPKVLHLG